MQLEAVCPRLPSWLCIGAFADAREGQLRRRRPARAALRAPERRAGLAHFAVADSFSGAWPEWQQARRSCGSTAKRLVAQTTILEARDRLL
mmetsp:Transcript_56512/g.165253  ORF Transcript_56512/g.165253 Transcript_56512/m.165253 type:complete len:91 (-) Transcript_56512:289-561(-)